MNTKYASSRRGTTRYATVSTKRASQMIGVSIFSVQRWFDSGLLTGSTMPGGIRRISIASLNRFMKKHSIRPQKRVRAGLRKILIVENNARLLSVLKDELAQTGKYLVETVSSGMEAGLAVGEFRPDVLVLDVMLEDVPGSIIVRRVRETTHGGGIRIVAMSGKAGPSEIKEVLDAGANAFLQKPFLIKDFIKAIERRKNSWK